MGIRMGIVFSLFTHTMIHTRRSDLYNRSRSIDRVCEQYNFKNKYCIWPSAARFAGTEISSCRRMSVKNRLEDFGPKFRTIIIFFSILNF